MKTRGGETCVVEFTATIVDGHVAAFPGVFAVSEELVHEVVKSEATVLEYACFSVLRKDNVLRVQC